MFYKIHMWYESQAKLLKEKKYDNIVTDVNKIKKM